MDTNSLDADKGGNPFCGVLSLASEVVAAYVSNNRIASNDIPHLIQQVHATLLGLKYKSHSSTLGHPASPAVPIQQSVTNDYIICLEDGKKLKMLKRHLRAVYNMTPEQYRERWGLMPDYPMVAPNYAKKRSSLAKLNGLGRSNVRRSAFNDVASNV